VVLQLASPDVHLRTETDQCRPVGPLAWERLCFYFVPNVCTVHDYKAIIILLFFCYKFLCRLCGCGAYSLRKYSVPANPVKFVFEKSVLF